MDDEFDKLMEFFSLESQEKEQKLDEIFHKSMEFFDKYKDILSSGSEEERAHMKKKMETLRSKLKEENQRAQNRVQLTPEEIKEIASDSKNFTPSQWEFLQKAKENLAKEKSEKEMRIQMQKRERQKQLREKGKRRSSSRKSGWMKS